MTYHMFSRTGLIILLTALIAAPVQAQVPAETDTGLSNEDVESVIAPYQDSRSQCLDVYKLGSVRVRFDSSQSATRVAPAGQVVIAGTVENTNDYPLPEGRLLARVLRQDSSVADDNWHPIVAEEDVPGDFNLPAEDEVPFTYSWTVPTGAPEGRYRVEFNFLAGGRYSMSGLSFVPNFTAGSQIFQVVNPGEESYVEFDRSSIALQGEALTLRSVPPTLSPNEPVAIEAALLNPSSQPHSVTVTSELHEWSDSDKEAPIETSTQEIQLAAGAQTTIPFEWSAAKPGVYELVHTAVSQTPGAMPSIIKVRFPVEGVAPRIMFSGITNVNPDNSVTVTTCAVNGTQGDGTGSFTAASTSGQETQAQVASGTVATSALLIPAEELRDGLALSLTARDNQGNITDSHTVTYDRSLLDDIIPPAQASETDASTGSDDQSIFGSLPDLENSLMLWVGLGILLLIIVLVIWLAVTKRRDNNRPSEPSAFTPNSHDDV